MLLTSRVISRPVKVRKRGEECGQIFGEAILWEWSRSRGRRVEGHFSALFKVRKPACVYAEGKGVW